MKYIQLVHIEFLQPCTKQPVHMSLIRTRLRRALILAYNEYISVCIRIESFSNRRYIISVQIRPLQANKFDEQKHYIKGLAQSMHMPLTKI